MAPARHRRAPRGARLRRARHAPRLSPPKRRQLNTWQKNAPGRPRVGEGFRRWNVSLEKSFARAADAYAKQHGKTRSSLIAEALTLYIQKVA